MLSQVAGRLSFCWPDGIVLYVNTTFTLPVHPLTDTQVSVPLLAIVNNAAMESRCRYLFGIVISDICPEVNMLEHMVVLYLIFLRNFNTVSHAGSTNLHSQQYARIAFSLCTLQHLPFFVFLMLAILTGMR